MKVSGFTFIRNAIKYDYPIVEAIRSILPLCDEVIVAVGKSEDDTLALIKSIDSKKIKIIHTIWNDDLREGGKVLAEETDKAFQNISKDADWGFYIQGDEVVHEQYLKTINDAMVRYKNESKVDGLLFKYLHFYGAYDFVGDAYKWYRNEVRIVKNNQSIFSWRDAQGFRKGNNQKLNVKPIDAYIYHYGWVKPPTAQQQKQETFHKLWHEDAWLEKNVSKTEGFDYSTIDSLQKFEGSHPKVMQERIAQQNWTFDYDFCQNRLKGKDRLKRFVEKWTGWRIGEYKNYVIISDG